MTDKLRLLDLFSGIGGFSLGLERTGVFETIAFCECDPYCRAVLRKHWPDVPIYDDVRTLTAARLAADGILVVADATGEHDGCGYTETRGGQVQQSRNRHGAAIDVICGGFPCQDISVAGKGAGIEGSRSGLWSEYARIIGEVRPRYVIVENVAALLGRGLSRVLGDLAALGYDAEWHCIPACAVGAPHRRDRIWIVADADEKRAHGRGTRGAGWPELANGSQSLADAEHLGRERRSAEGNWTDSALPCRQEMADATSPRQSQSGRTGTPLRGRQPLQLARLLSEPRGDWFSEPNVGRVAHGVPSRVDRIRALGNAVVPQIPEMIGRAIMKAEAA